MLEHSCVYAKELESDSLHSIKALQNLCFPKWGLYTNASGTVQPSSVTTTDDNGYKPELEVLVKMKCMFIFNLEYKRVYRYIF